MSDKLLPEHGGHVVPEAAPAAASPKSSLSTRCLLTLALLYTIYFAKSLLLPIVVALLFALLLSPSVQMLKRFYVPRALSAMLILCLIGGPLALLANQLVEPAQRWAKAIPELTDQFTQRVDNLTDSLTTTPEPAPPPAPAQSTGFTFFGLFGNDDAADSAINTCLGLATATALWLLGVQDALLWGVLVGMLNFAPYVGPLLAVIILLLAGVVQYGTTAAAVMPALVYFSINLIESQFITPLIIGRNMRLNPLVIIIWLVIWGWLWGTIGVLLAMPLLVCLKLAVGQSKSLRHWVQLIESRQSD